MSPRQGSEPSMVEESPRAEREAATAEPLTVGSAQNPFYGAFDLLFAQLLAHEEVLAHAERALASVEQAPVVVPEAELEPRSGRFPGFVADICTLEEKRYVRLLPTFRIPERSEAARRNAIARLRRRWCNLVVAESFESFRVFAVAVETELIRAVAPSDLNKCEHSLRSQKEVAARPPRDDVKTTLQRIRKTAPSLIACERINARRHNLQEWVAVVAAARHAIAHGDGGIVSPRKLEHVNQALLEKTFPGTHISGVGYMIELVPDAARDVIDGLREYGLAVYKAASEAVGAEARIIGPDGIITEWRR